MPEPKDALSDKDREELAQLRAEKYKAENAPKPKSLDEQIREMYIHNAGPIQAIARHFHVSVDQVLVAIGQPEMTKVDTIGDLVDSSDLGPNDAPAKLAGNPAKPTYSLD